MRCQNCGRENRPDARFCKQCGQSLLPQAAPPSSPATAGAICPACGATTKPGAHFCPRCGKPLPTEPAPAAPPQPAQTQPSMPEPHAAPSSPPPSTTPPPAYATPPTPPPSPAQPPSTAVPAAPKHRSSRWLWWTGGILALLCVAAIVAMVIVFGPKVIGTDKPAATPTPTEPLSETPVAEAPPTEMPATQTPTIPVPTETPTSESPIPMPTAEALPLPSFDVQIGIAASAPELQPGDLVTITITITNTGQAPFGSMRYQVLGEWEPYLKATADLAAEHELDVAPGGSDMANFVLEAAQAGTARLQANVTMKTRGELPSLKAVSSEGSVEIAVNQ